MSEVSHLMTPQDMRRQIKRLSVPIIIESIFALSGNLVFIALLGRIDGVGLDSITHVAAHGMATVVTGIIWWLLKGVGIGATIRVSQNYGAGFTQRIKEVGIQTLVLNFILGIICAIGMYLIAPLFISLYNPAPATGSLAVDYIRVACLGFPFLGIMHTATGVLQGVGNTKTPMLFSGLLNIIFVLAGIPFIFGYIGSPLGVVGSAIALVIGQIATASAGLYALFNAKGPLALERGDKLDYYFKPKPLEMWDIARVGVPTGIENIFWQFSAMLIGRIMLGYGELAYAANQIGVQAEAIANMPASSFGIVTVTLCGRAIGARDKELGQNYIKEIRKTSLVVVAFGMVLLILLPMQLLRPLSPNQEVVSLAAVYLRLMGLVLPFNTLMQINQGALKSSGFANIPMFTAMAGLWLVRVPFSYWSSLIANSTIVWLWVVVFFDIFVRFIITLFAYRKKSVFAGNRSIEDIGS